MRRNLLEVSRSARRGEDAIDSAKNPARASPWSGQVRLSSSATLSSLVHASVVLSKALPRSCLNAVEAATNLPPRGIYLFFLMKHATRRLLGELMIFI